ncbi:MAG: sumo domain-containing protein [archaeon]|nr:sumo domain-containing protein [archaeon]
MNKTTKFNKLMNAYCKKAGYQPGAVKFFFDGKLISEDDCPNSMGISNEDEIEALTDQYGGGSFC